MERKSFVLDPLKAKLIESKKRVDLNGFTGGTSVRSSVARKVPSERQEVAQEE